MPDPLINTWRKIIRGEQKSWVLFENGTCVILMQPQDDLAAQGTEILKEWGPVHAGTPSGDFSVTSLAEHPGWVVTCHHPDVLNYVGPEDVREGAPDFVIGIVGRTNRDQDAQHLKVIHVEDCRVTRG